ncbi:MAG: hypothetical protein IJE97_15760 [Thermoguttaceae bacterium]|nr:hypothetical protein [Thermoguttaceae bacterium]MBQ6827471.1 hypothetical protein [Thermoguttaceae bacterium]
MLNILKEVNELYLNHRFKAIYDTTLYMFLNVAYQSETQNLDPDELTENPDDEGVMLFKKGAIYDVRFNLTRAVKAATEFIIATDDLERYPEPDEAKRLYLNVKDSPVYNCAENVQFRAAENVIGIAAYYAATGFYPRGNKTCDITRRARNACRSLR